jgi:hypothetical protein
MDMVREDFVLNIMPERFRLARPRFADRAYRVSRFNVNESDSSSLWIPATSARE